ncbi:hypothetical protein RSK20926_05332 [Roseobacter sp. SK209-2-6]|nr:hypothetical protein RSK20926_05332 [Roseobacter sp. SK209-2-6]
MAPIRPDLAETSTKQLLNTKACGDLPGGLFLVATPAAIEPLHQHI